MNGHSEFKIALVKLGGSVLTNKSRLRSFSESDARRLASEVKGYALEGGRRRLVLVHGGGSFGHIRAKKYELSAGFKKRYQLVGFAQVRNDMRDLNARVVGNLVDEGIPAISFPPETFLKVRDGIVVKSDTEVLERCVAAGVVPVSFGDAVIDMGRTFGILSGDAVMLSLSIALQPAISVFCTDVDGVFDSNPKLSGDARLVRRLNESEYVNTDAPSVHDVTGEMGGKLKFLFDIAENSSRTLVINGRVRSRLEKALSGRSVTSTEVIPRYSRSGSGGLGKCRFNNFY
ncbi:MAG: isopentenyl phosphate kinase [Candidatus Thermoplasmatota archaeon]|nr:isopentenyl phosphate kinase [Candidatus Thermoplasmatota archaeon]